MRFTFYYALSVWALGTLLIYAILCIPAIWLTTMPVGYLTLGGSFILAVAIVKALELGPPGPWR